MRIIFGSRHAACWVAMVLAPVASLADVCDVPSAEYPTVQRAVDTPICTTVNLTDPSYPESVLIRRSLSISGPAALAIIEGLVEVRGGGTVVQMDNLSIENGCTPSAFLTLKEARSIPRDSRSSGPTGVHVPLWLRHRSSRTISSRATRQPGQK